MTATRFDVNDPELRESFLRHDALPAFGPLEAAAPPRWGRMRAQEMVEHLLWTFELSTGAAQTECPVPAEQIPRLKRFLASNMATPPEFMNPVLVNGLPALRFASMAEARAALGREIERFLDSPTNGPLRTHPLFGPLAHEEWHRAHYKHVHHHLLQFGLIEPPAEAANGGGTAR